ncbi:MAG: LLM class flavin-dependent oxidoreductase, partial [candidate division NC10 bacterium]
MRLGCVLAAFTPLPLGEFLALAREVEQRGYHPAWVGEGSGYDAIRVMTLIASATERLHVGS